MGQRQHGRGRASAPGERPRQRVKPVVRPPLRILQPLDQLLGRLCLPHQPQENIRGGPRRPQPGGTRPVQPPDVPGDLPPRLAERSQWFQIDCDLALEVVLDAEYFPVFWNLCKNSCYSDEHYLPALVNMRFGERNTNRTLTRGGPHLRRFVRTDIHPGFFKGRGAGAAGASATGTRPPPCASYLRGSFRPTHCIGY